MRLHLVIPLLFAALPALAAASPSPASPSPASIVIDAASGRVLAQSQAGQTRHPASLTKMMTIYMAFRAMAEGRLGPKTVLTVSDRAAAQGGSVLGLKAGGQIHLEQALTALVVRSANDAAVAIAEHLAGSEDGFAVGMNVQAVRLGMNATHFANATGLTAPDHLSTARDMAVLALALRRDFPQRWALFSTTAMTWGTKHLPTVNAFVASYPGAEGLKTGFTCPAGYNLAAAAHRGERTAIAVVMGATAKAQRLSLASSLLNQAFARPADGTALNQLANDTNRPPDLSPQVCAGGGTAETGTTASLAPGWAMEVAFGRDETATRRDLARRFAQLRQELGGGKPAVVIRPLNGSLRYRGLITGLSESKAVSICLRLRRQDENSCLVLPPIAVQGAQETERRWRMLSAR